MKKLVYLSLVVVLVFLSACSPTQSGSSSLPTATLTTDQYSPSLNLDSDSDAIRLKMLYSHLFWDQIWVDAQVFYYSPGETSASMSERHQVWIDQSTASVRILMGNLDGTVTKITVSDGTQYMRMSLPSGQSEVFNLDLPQFNPTQKLSDVITFHPLATIIESPFAEVIFPTSLAQRSGGIYQPIAMEQVAGRDVLVVDWTREETGSVADRFWIDVDTGVLLRWRSYAKGQESGSVVLESLVTSIVYDQSFPDSLFSLPPDASPQFSDVYGAPLTETTPAPEYWQADEQGEVYFFIMDNTFPQSVKLMRLPGSCVTGESACPEPQVVTAPFDFRFSLTPLVWSPDGSMAAFAYPNSTDGLKTGLYVLDPDEQSWTKIAEFPFIDPPLWSLDGRWLAFRVQDGMGGEDLYAIRPDGTDLRNLTANASLPQQSRPYVMDGWTSNYLIVRSGKPGGEGIVYLLRVDDGLVRPMFETLLTKASYYPSPDGSLLAYNEYDYQSQKHTLRIIAPDGSGLRDLATFQKGNIYPLVWSPDISSVAFVNYDASQSETISDVYFIRRDGRDMRLVYRGSTISSLLFSPDGRFLLVEDYTTTGSSLFVIDLETLEQRLLQAPGLSSNVAWRLPSWRLTLLGR